MSDKPQTLEEKLKSELETAEWEILKPHFERESLIIVSEELDILKVALTVAQGNLKQVELWMKDNLLTKPTPQQMQAWKQNPQTPFLFLIVQPWVFAQLKGN